jgi:cytochrome c oxidase subunit IV
MSAATLAHAASHSPTESKFHIFVEVAMLLAVITGVEIIVIYLPLPQLLVLGVLAFLSLVKFMFVIFIFMHLKWDKLFCTVMFFIGLTLATGTVTALYFLFAARDSKPVGSAYDAAALTAPASSARNA